jgi:hypothetical protein
VDVFFSSTGNKRDVISEYGNYASKVHSVEKPAGPLLQSHTDFLDQISVIQAHSNLDDTYQRIPRRALEEDEERAKESLTQATMKGKYVSPRCFNFVLRRPDYAKSCRFSKFV